MSLRAILTLALLALLAQTLLAMGFLAGAPALLRVVLAASALVLAPGAAWLALLGVRPPGGAWLAAGWALGLGVAWNALLTVATSAAQVPFTVLGTATLATTALLWTAVLLRRRAPASGAGAVAPPELRPEWGLLVLAAAGAAGVYAARLGAPLTYISDSPDHIGTLRRMLEHGRSFPTDAFFRDAGVTGIDPRKFLWHSQAALVSRLAGVSPVEAWRDLPTLLSPLLVLNAAALGMLVGGSGGAATAAWAVLLTQGGSLAQSPMRETVFSAKLADHLSLAAAVALLCDVRRPSRAGRLAAVGLAVGAVSTHVFAAAQFALVDAALGLGLLLRDRRAGPDFRRVVGTALAVGAAVLPFALWQVLRTPHSHNLIHTESQGLLTLWGHVRIVSPGVLTDWMGNAWLLFPLLAIPLWRNLRSNAAALFLLTTTAAAWGVLFFPPLVSLLEPKLGYLIMRVVWMTPLAGLLGWAVPFLIAELRTRERAGRVRAVLLLSGIAVLLAPAVADAVRVARGASAIAADERARSPLAWGDALEWMNRELPHGLVVLSDPITSYSIPMLTSDYVVTLLDQHSSPSDAHALDRLLDARDALDPFGDWSRTREVVRRYGVDVIVLNNRFIEIPRADYWAPRPEWFAAARARLDHAPAAFERVYDRGDFVVYRIRPVGLDTLSTPHVSRPFVSAYRLESSGVARRMAAGLPAVLGASLAPHVVHPGDTLRGVIGWRPVGRSPAGSYLVAVRFDRALPDGLAPPAWLAKPTRKIAERLNHERYRFREDHLPVGGEYGVDLWTPEQVVRDSFTLAVPRDVADGLYRVQVRMLRQPHYPNLRLSDYFFDDDYFSGLTVGTLEVRRGSLLAAPEGLAPPPGPVDGGH